MKLFFRKVHKSSKGFTLVETLVAISIFTVALTGLMGVLTKGLSNTVYAQKSQTATYLAQEGIEYMRNMRDTFVLYSSTAQIGWSDPTNSFNHVLVANSCTSLPNGCYFNADGLFSFLPISNMPMTKIAVTACNGVGGACPELKYDSATGRYNYSSGTNSGFIRKITVATIGSPINEIKVTSTVYWTQGSVSSNISFSEDLFNWIE